MVLLQQYRDRPLREYVLVQARVGGSNQSL